jgi:glutamate formiminotransferase
LPRAPASIKRAPKWIPNLKKTELTVKTGISTTRSNEQLTSYNSNLQQTAIQLPEMSENITAARKQGGAILTRGCQSRCCYHADRNLSYIVSCNCHANDAMSDGEWLKEIVHLNIFEHAEKMIMSL